MPEERAPNLLNDVSLDQEALKLSGQGIEDAYALKLVTDTFDKYEQFRSNNHDPRWNGADALYCSYVPSRTWEGTNIPKAALSNPVTFSHIETMLPIIEQALFGSDIDWFQVTPEPGGNPQEARAIQQHMLYLLEHDHDEFGKTARREIVMAVKQMLMLGNGGIKVYYDPTKKRPCVEWRDIRDIYVSPGTTTPSIDESNCVIERLHYTVDELDAMRGNSSMNIPANEVLNYFASNYRSTTADRTKSVQEAFRGVNYQPGSSDYAPLPADRKVEVLIYNSKSRIVWVIGREWVAFNGSNPYGFVGFCFAPCYTFPGRFYALSVPDVLGDAQQYISGLYNARLNELSLILNPPRIKKPGSTMTPSQERYYPGATFNVTDPKNDMAFQTPQQATANVMGDIDYMLMNTEKITGANGIVSGTPRGGNVNRTATGVSSQSQGGSSRIYYIIKNIEDYLIVPMLYKLYKFIQYHTSPNDLLPALGPDDQVIQVGAEAFQAPIRFQMVSASRMLTKDKLMAIMPFLSQYYLNGSFIEQLHGTGKTVDFDEFQRLIQDASGTGRLYKLVRPMTQQEQQALSQPPPQVVAQQQVQQQKNQTLMQMEQMKNQTALQVESMRHQGDAQQAQVQQAQAAQQMQQQQVQAALEQKRKNAEAAQKAHTSAIQTVLAARQKHSELLMKQAEQNQKLHQEQQTHNQKLQHAEQQNNEKLRIARLMAALKAQAQMQPPAPQPTSNE